MNLITRRVEQDENQHLLITLIQAAAKTNNEVVCDFLVNELLYRYPVYGSFAISIGEKDGPQRRKQWMRN